LGGEGFFTGQTLNWMTSYGRAVICLSTWLAPVTGLILYRGWLQAVRPLTPIAVLDTNRLTPRLWHITLPLLAPYGAVAWLAALILALTEYSIPHLCLVQTWNTEVLAAAQAQPNAGALFRLAWPLVLLVVTAAGGLSVSRPWLRGVMTGSDTETADVGRLRAGWRVSLSRGAGAIVATAVLLTPLVALWRGIEDWSAFGTVWRTYPREWPTAVLAASVSGAAALLITLGLFQWRIRSRNSRLQGGVAGGLIVLVVLAALMPPVVVGDATKAASVWLEQLGDWTHSFTREWPLLSMVGALRFAAILMLAGLITGRRIRDRYLPLAQTDGLRAREFTWHVFAPLAWPTLLGGTVIVALLSLGEVAASQLVRAPNVDSLAITLLNMIHFGRNDQIIALGLTVTGFVGFCVVLILVLARLWRGPTPPAVPTTR
jgi:ABC-type Fe3+ transport system permease subunit